MTTRYVGNDKVPPEHRRALRVLKALKQGRELAPRSWWPALEGLSPRDRAAVQRQVAEEVVWKCHSQTIGRFPNHIPPAIPWRAA